MLMKQPKTLRKKLKALTDPKPEFVSLVFAGANKTPFRALRAADGEGLIPMTEEARHKQDTHAIASIEFDGNKFKSEAAVKVWLSQGGYTDATVAKTEKGWVAKGAGSVPANTEIQTVDLKDDGVTMHVFEMSPGTPEDSTKTENSLRAKFDGCRAAVSSTYEEGRKKGAIKDIGPEMLNLTMALYDEVRTALRSGDKVAVKAAIEEYEGYVDQLLDMFPGTEVPSMKAFVDAIAPEVDVTKETETAPEAVSTEEELDAAKEVVDQTDEAEEAEKEEEDAEEAEASDESSEKEEDAEDAEKGMNERGKNKKPYMKDDEADSSEDADDETSEKEEDADDETAEKESDDEDAEAEEASAEKSEDPIMALTAVVGNLAQSVKDMQDNLSQKTDVLAERVAAIEETRQTRKSADVDEANSGNTEQRKKTDSQEMDELRTRSVLGMRR